MDGMNRVQVLTVDDQAVFREAARALIDSTPGFEVAGEAACGADALRAVERLAPDLVLMDVCMPGMDGIETARRIAAAGSDSVIVLVTAHHLDDVQPLAEHSGAAAIITKERLRPRLLRALWAANGARRAPTGDKTD
jgi:two-component system, NarL family, invasion response regulator UvrY